MSVDINATNIVIAIIIIIFDICICFIVAEAEDEASSGWGDLNERWQALRGSPPPQRRRLASPPPSSPGSLAAPLVVDEDGRPVIPPPPEPMPMPTGVFFYKSFSIMFEIAEFSPPPASVALDSFGLPVAATSNIELTPPSINSSLHFSVSADAMEVFQQGRNNLILPCHNCSLASATTQLPAGQDKQSTNPDDWAHP